MAASVRGFCSHCSIGADFEGDVLGSEQWDWLDSQLTDSTAAVHIIVSSIQVQTSNPLVESWGHFPASRARLISLLNKHRPAGLLLLGFVFCRGVVHGILHRLRSVLLLEIIVEFIAESAQYRALCLLDCAAFRRRSVRVARAAAFLDDQEGARIRDVRGDFYGNVPEVVHPAVVAALERLV